MNNIRYTYLQILFLTYIVITILTRIGLLFYAGVDPFGDWHQILLIFGLGLLNDIIPFFLMTLPLAALVLLPKTRHIKHGTCIIMTIMFGVYTTLFLFTAVSEGIFWEEFNCRFNFIAVDYLIYTKEVIHNILESYPVIPILIGITLCAIVLSRLLLHPVYKHTKTLSSQGRYLFGIWLVISLIGFVYSPFLVSGNIIYRELSANGIWSLFSAFKNNQLDYRQFYPIIDESKALQILRLELTEPNTTFIKDNTHPKLDGWRRHIRATRPEKPLNVIQIVVESLGSNLLGERTPNLNTIAQQSLSFTRMMATGTRTVRGIEALTLSLPPTPGSSIVRRPGNEGLFTVGSVFRRHGYDTTFIYGGYGYFDNMNAFFSGNGFRIVDRAVIPDMYKTFGNAWGLCDEDLFNAALREADASYANGKHFYQFVLTTSNHRPFTYPDGKVDLPSGKSRSGAIKYTDYAIGQFLREAAKHPWFQDTLFIIIADHTSGCAGRTDIHPENYHIPCFIYSPKHIEARTVDTLCSQIDVTPTILALLGWSYDSNFFGKNILTTLPKEERAWLGTYQLLGRLTHNGLVILEPLKQPILEEHASFKNTDSNGKDLILSTIAGYQIAQDLFMHGWLKEKKP